MKKCFQIGLKTIFSLFLLLSLQPCAFAAQENSQIESQSSIPQIMAAAENGDPDAQYALGYMYYYGRGISPDMKLAKEWIRKAANQGQQQAIQAEKILLGMTPTIQPKVNPIVPSTSDSPDKAGAPVEKLKTIRAEPVEQENKIQTQNKIQPQEKKVVEPVETSPVPLVEEKAAGTEPTPEPKPTPKPKPVVHHTSAKPAKAKKEKVTTPSALKNVKGSYFTLQLIASSSKKDVVRYIQKSHLKQASYYETYRDGHPWYVVTYGKYASRKAASAAIRTLPESVRNNNPWVKSSQVIDKEIKKKG